MAKGNGLDPWLTRQVNYVDRDPEIDKFRALYEKEAISRDSELAVLAGLSSSTVTNLWSKTRRPQHLTYAKIAGAMGFEYGLSRVKKPDYEAELAVARGEFKEHRQRLLKQRGKKKKK